MLTSIGVLMLLVLNVVPGFSQSDPVATVDSLNPVFLNWFDKSPAHDKIEGVAADRTYTELIGSTAAKKKVVVAVIDGGVDTAHIDLKGRIWVNQDEIPGNGIDDDGNGYVDDIHGWNFLGNKSGENLRYANYEEVRILRKLEPRFRDVDTISQVDPAEIGDYELYRECKASIAKKKAKFQTLKSNIEYLELNITYAENIIREFLGKDTFSIEDIQQIESDRNDVNMMKNYLLRLHTNGLSKAGIDDLMEMAEVHLEKQLNPDFDPQYIIGDDPDDIHDSYYGNNDVTGPDAFHGTFVAGIIAAIRDNGIGINGIASSVEIMSVRAVPDGDERDKDVALAIRYAVDNGADIINMSFGKDFSPHKDFVDDAVKYAESHYVLMIHAAGNDANDIDNVPSFPMKKMNDGTQVSNWITVGANSKTRDADLAASFSNYGKKNVDLFAPGVNMISLHPGNLYEMGDGTSFAAPSVSGVAALVLSYHPDLSAQALKDVILNSTSKVKRLKVRMPVDDNSDEPGDPKTVRFGSLSVTGGIVNVYKAFKKAGK